MGTSKVQGRSAEAESRLPGGGSARSQYVCSLGRRPLLQSAIVVETGSPPRRIALPELPEKTDFSGAQRPTIRCSLAAFAACELRPIGVKNYGQDDDAARDHLPDEIPDAHQDQAIREYPNETRAEEGANQ